MKLKEGTRVAQYDEQDRCPICGSDDVEHDNWHTDGVDEDRELYVTRLCADCGAYWTEVYEMNFKGTQDIQDREHRQYLSVAAAKALLNKDDLEKAKCLLNEYLSKRWAEIQKEEK